MEIITTHGNTDFDAFASMLAAKKLYPKARIFFSGTKERALESFLRNPYYNYDEIFLRDINPDQLERIILVDVCSAARIGPVAQYLEKPGVEVIIYDHHTTEEDIIAADIVHMAPLGACTTILVNMLKEKGIAISKMEATVFAMGIFEDTGFLTYSTTTPEDARQIAYLMECGADLTMVSKFLKSDLSRPQITLMNELIANAAMHDVNGVQIVISTASRDEYFQDAAAVVHKLMEVERYPVYIAAIRMGDRIHLIGRSRHQRVSLGAVFKKMGGGGHPPAAHATLTGMTLVEVVEKVLGYLHDLVLPAVTASDIMTPNLVTIGPEATVSEAHNEMVRANINSIPIVEKDSVIGLVTRQQLGRAISHKLKGTVRDIMTPEFTLIDPDDSIEVAENRIMEGTLRSVLVGKSRDSVEGIITRMDLFRRLYLERMDAASHASEFRHTKLRHFGVLEMIGKRLPEGVQDVLRNASQVAETRSERVFLVGGIVRDLILDYENHDVDLVVIGDGIEFANDLSKILGGYAHSHQQFGTSVIVLPDGFRVDVVTARRESYAYPGALPEVSSGSLRADLYRRDFTINALAIDLTPRFYGHIVDYFGGMRDIQNRNIRILHGLSFIDDPTRMLRAVRFSVRLNFRLSEGTRLMLESAVRKNMLKRVSGKRIQSEMVHLLEGPRPLSSLEQLSALGLLTNIHRKIKLDRFTMELLQNISRTVGWFKITFPEEKPRIFMMYYMALFEKLTYNERRSLCKRLITATRESKPLLQYKQQVKRAVHLFRKERTPLPSRVTELFDNYSIESILYTHAFAHSQRLKRAIADYLTTYRHQRLDISGKFLEKLGLEKGPVFGSILQEIRNAKLDGEIRTKKQQQAMARELAEKQMNRQASGT